MERKSFIPVKFGEILPSGLGGDLLKESVSLVQIFYFQQITSYSVQYIQFIRKLGLERKRKL